MQSLVLIGGSEFGRGGDGWLGHSTILMIDPKRQIMMVLRLESEQYIEVGIFKEERLVSPTFPDLQLTVEQIF